MIPSGNRNRMRLIILLVVFGAFVLVGGAAAVGWFVFRLFTSRVMEVVERPQELEHAGIVVGAGLLVKEPLVQFGKLDVGADESLDGEVIHSEAVLRDARFEGWGSVTDIVRGQLDGEPGVDIVVAWDRGAVFLDDSGAIKSSVGFDDAAQGVRIVDVEGDGVCEFIYEVMGGSRPRLVDHTGGTRWTYTAVSKSPLRTGPFPGEICGGDVDGDGRLEFAVGYVAFGGVHLVDRTGKLIWQKRDTNVFQIAMADTDGDGRDEIIHNSASRVLKIRDGSGEVIGKVKRRGSLAMFNFPMHFSLCPWPSKDGPERILEAGKDAIRMRDFEGEVVAEFEAPPCGVFAEARGTPVRLTPDEPPHLAVVVSSTEWDRSVFCVYQASGDLVYEEVLEGTCGAIAAVPLDEPDREAILLGGWERVWKYRPADSPS